MAFLHPNLPKFLDSVESEVIGVVVVVGAALAVVEGSAGKEDDVLAFKKPIYVLKAVFDDFRML